MEGQALAPASLLGCVYDPGRMEVTGTAGRRVEHQTEFQRFFGGGTAPSQKWSLTPGSLRTWLLACLADDRETAGEKYLEIRRNLIRFFEWRGCPFPEDHADRGRQSM